MRHFVVLLVAALALSSLDSHGAANSPRVRSFIGPSRYSEALRPMCRPLTIGAASQTIGAKGEFAQA